MDDESKKQRQQRKDRRDTYIAAMAGKARISNVGKYQSCMVSKLRIMAGTADGASSGGGGAGSQPAATPRTVAGNSNSRLAFSPVTEMTEEFMKDAGRQM